MQITWVPKNKVYILFRTKERLLTNSRSMAQRATRPHTFLGIPNSWDWIAPVKDHTYTVQQDEYDNTAIQQRRTVGKGVDIGCDDDDAPRKAVDVIQLRRTFRTKSYSTAEKTYLFIPNSTCPTQPIRLSCKSHCDWYLRYRDIARAQRIGERIGTT